MNPAQLLAHFDRIGEAPDAIPRLRRFILDLAVRGKLVTQDSTETVGDSIPEIRPQFGDCVTPENWRWTEFGEVATISGGFAFKSGDYAPSGVFVLRVTNIEPSGVISKSDAVFLAKEKISPEIERFYLNPGDILLVMVGGSLGKIGVVLADVLPALLNQNLWRITPANEEVDRHFLKLLIDFIVSFQRKITHSTHGHLSREDFRKKAIALPPLAEQHRIVAKVDELMELCDRLETAQTERESRRDRLVASSLHHLSNGADPDAFREHACFYFNHLPRLTTRPDHIKQLRQTILNLAVRGRLTPSLAWPEQPVPLRQFATLQNGYAFKSEWFSRSGVRLLRNVNVSHDVIRWDDLAFLPKIRCAEFERFRLNEGDVVLSLDRPFIVSGTKVARVRSEDLPCLLLQRVGRFQPKLEQLCPEYLFLWLHSPNFTDQINPGRSNGVPHISSKQVESAVLFVPSLAGQQRIVAKVNELMARCNQLETQLTTTQSESHRLLEAILHEALARSKGKN